MAVDGVCHMGVVTLIKLFRAYMSQNKVAVVCSARSSGKKVTGTTSRRVLTSSAH